MMKATPVEAKLMANEIFSPRMYATKIPGTWSAGKTLRASAYDSQGVEAWGRARENLDEHVDEGGLRGRDHEGAADSLEEEKDGRHLSQIRSRGGSLDRDDRDLGCNAPADTSDDLIPDPLRLLSADVERIKQPRTDHP